MCVGQVISYLFGKGSFQYFLLPNYPSGGCIVCVVVCKNVVATIVIWYLGSMTIISRLLLCLVKDHLLVGLFYVCGKGSTFGGA